MKHRPLVLSRLDGPDKEYDITKIANIIDEVTTVTIIYKFGTKRILNKEDYFYLHWDSFRGDIRRRFILSKDKNEQKR
jgi:hypothetical protein